ncbi:putative receptor-like protein kinase [Dorcoceras hygrometricum]|uniref:Putative receptor-like protein kinase n=1 Tax=Dorcoceras hygrometricum TaxID=472368 RepID=A0A2Z7BMB4_9LAMI|nr:putative receptor-like protein kinase [Dorcoceras hygrometricum]
MAQRFAPRPAGHSAQRPGTIHATIVQISGIHGAQQHGRARQFVRGRARAIADPCTRWRQASNSVTRQSGFARPIFAHPVRAIDPAMSQRRSSSVRASHACKSSSGARLPCATIAHVARVHARDMEERRRALRGPSGRFSIFVSDLKFNVRYNYDNSY